MLMPFDSPPAPPPEVPTTTLTISPPVWDCAMIESLAQRFRQEGRSLEYVVYPREFSCDIYVVGTDAVMEEFEWLVSSVLQTIPPKE